MAISVDTVYQRVQSILNKESRGYLTPQEFNLFANQAQLEIFEQYFFDLNQYERLPKKDTEYSNLVKIINERISKFKKSATLTYSTRTNANNNNDTDQFSWGSFTPLDTANSFFISGQIPINSAGQDFCGFGLRFAGNTGNTDFSGDGVGYAASYNHMGIHTYHFNYTGSFHGADTYTIYHRTYGSNSQPDCFCPNSSDDARLVAQTSGTLQIIEYANA